MKLTVVIPVYNHGQAVGAVVAGGSVGLYAYSQREPTRITGF